MDALLRPTVIKLIILGLLSGILSGALGVGSGILLIPGNILRKCFAIFILIVGVRMLIK